MNMSHHKILGSQSISSLHLLVLGVHHFIQIFVRPSTSFARDPEQFQTLLAEIRVHAGR